MAIQRAEIIMKVRSGIMTATEAARELGVSRKTYYKWEKRGLAALLDGLSDQPTGRPEIPGTPPEEVELARQLAELRAGNDRLRQQLGLKTLIRELDLDQYQQRTKKK